MKKSFSLLQTVLLFVFAVLMAICITIMAFQGFFVSKEPTLIETYSAKIKEIEALVNEYYTGDVNQEQITDGLSVGYLIGLGDKYASYTSAETAEENLNGFYGVNTGMGIEISMHPDNKNIYVLDVHKDSPAQTAGILSGDLIVKIDENVVSQFGYTESLMYIKQRPIDSTVHLVIKRGEKEIELDVVLKYYASQSVFYKLLDKDKGYIQISEFNDRSVDQFKNAITDLTEKGAKSLVFDLRGNGGGTLNSVYKMVDYLVPEGLVVKVEYKDSANNQVFMSDKSEINMPMVVLTDGNTASAAELFAQSLKDYKKAITIGQKTYGKGVVQRTFTLSDGSLVKFTVAKYYTANGSCLDGIGVEPDIKTDWTEEEARYRLINGIKVDKDFLAACDYLDGKS